MQARSRPQYVAQATACNLRVFKYLKLSFSSFKCLMLSIKTVPVVSLRDSSLRDFRLWKQLGRRFKFLQPSRLIRSRHAKAVTPMGTSVIPATHTR